jgi:TonB-dependent SusC/RagA subfamily outer membrane receptor
METFIIYLGKVALAIGAFYLVFLVLFQNRKQFVFNRIYLLASMLISYFIPLITITITRQIEAMPTPVFPDYNFTESTVPVAVTFEKSYEWYHYIFGILIAGVAGFTINFLIGNFKALNIIRKSYKKEDLGSEVCITSEDVHPFSFFNKVIVSSKALSHPNLQLILAHENLHIKEKHTIDILIAEIFFLFQWFNPFAWLLKDAIKNNLEYITDEHVIKYIDRETYQLAMVSLADKKGVAPFLNALNGSQLKNRIIMMKKKTNNRFALVKQLALIPILTLLIIGLSNKEFKAEVIENPNKIQSEKPLEKIVTNKLMNFDDGEKTIKQDSILKIKRKADADKPLFLLDGKPITEIEDIEPESIERIEVLKDESATILYGEKGKNGVVLITSKKEDKIKVIGYGDGKTKSGSNIKIRGTHGIDGEGEPLYILDGKEVKSIENIAPETIESINVLKDESAKAAYGEKGKNGVILITTKKEDKIKVTSYGDGKTNSGSNIKIRGTRGIDGEGEPLYILDGKEVKSIENIDPETIESINVLKDKSATILYGDKGENGVVLITSKQAAIQTASIKTKDGKEPLIVVDGEMSDKTFEELNILPENIKCVDIYKDASTNEKYGDKGKNGVIEITTKEGYSNAIKIKTRDNDSEPLIIIDGKESEKSIKALDMDPGKIKSISVWKGDSAIIKYGEKGENGVINLETGEYLIKTPIEISSELELRRFIAERIKYPVIAQESNQQGIVKLYVVINDNGKIIKIYEDEPKGRYKKLDEVVVVGYGKTGKEKSKDKKPTTELIKEAIAVTGAIPKINVPSLLGKTIQLTYKFELQ